MRRYHRRPHGRAAQEQGFIRHAVPLGLKICADSHVAGPEKDGFTFDRVFDTTTRQDEIFDWGVKGIVEGDFHKLRVSTYSLLVNRCYDGFQRYIVLLRANWFW